MGVLWQWSPLSVREVCRRLSGRDDPAYTTVMTTLDRLFKKGLLRRHKVCAAFMYEPAMSRDEYRRRVLAGTISYLSVGTTDANQILVAFVDAAADIDEANLGRLETLVAERMGRGRKQPRASSRAAR